MRPEDTTERDGGVPRIGILRVLAVDDEPSMREVVCRILAARGHEVAAAANAEEALKLLRQSDFAVMVTDLSMPGADGVELVKRASVLAPGIATAVLTGYGSLDSARQAMRMGVMAYVLKPVDPGELVRVVEHLLGLVRARRERDLYHDELAARYGELQRSEAVREGLVNMMTKELRVPLGLARTNLEILAEESIGALTETQQALATDSLEACDQAFRMVDELLISRMLADGTLHLELEALDLCEATKSVVDELHKHASEAGISVVFERPDTLLQVSAEIKLLRWMLKALVKQAIEVAETRVVIKGANRAERHGAELTIETDRHNGGAGRPGSRADIISESLCRLAAESLGGSLQESGETCRLILPVCGVGGAEGGVS